MKIAIDCRFIGKSGIGTYIENVVSELLRNHPEHEFLIVCPPTMHIPCSHRNVIFLVTSIQPFSWKELFYFPTKSINQGDAFFSPYINIPKGIKVPVYSTIHDVVFFDVDGLVSSIGKFIRKFYFKRAIRLSKKIFTVSEFSKERILYHFPTNKDIVVTGNGVSNYIKQYSLDKVEKKNYYIYVGNIKTHKGLQTLVNAYGKARSKGLGTRLVIVGNNEKFRSADKDLTSLIEAIPEIQFTGWVTNEQLMTLIAEAKALIQPSLYEGFGIPPLEALYLGTNVILSDIPVFKEIYYNLPVTFFEVGDSEDLANKLLSAGNTDIPKDIKRTIKDRFCYKKVANKIIEEILNDTRRNL